MRLTKVTINNFRSISNIEIEFEPTCRVLVGINESGKTNILKALSLLDKDTESNNEDLRESLPNEAPVTEGFVRFIFTLDKEERLKAYESIADKILGDVRTEPIVDMEGKLLTLAQYFDTKTTTLYRVDLADNTKGWKFWSDTKSKVISEWSKPVKNATAMVRVNERSAAQVLTNFKLTHSAAIREVQSDQVEPVSTDELNRIVGLAIHEVVKDKLPQCIYWEYNEKNLLPPQIEIASFAADPNVCLPMRHMFSLAGFNDPKSAIDEAQGRPNGLRNLLKRVSELSTKHMHSVWKDYRGIRLELIQNGDKIDAHVEDTYNVYNLSRRSDGFKRFITFLLLVSAQARTRELQNTLYLHDEPDISLHPSGARYLRDELIKIAATNYVVYSTHSIFHD